MTHRPSLNSDHSSETELAPGRRHDQPTTAIPWLCSVKSCKPPPLSPYLAEPRPIATRACAAQKKRSAVTRVVRCWRRLAGSCQHRSSAEHCLVILRQSFVNRSDLVPPRYKRIVCSYICECVQCLSEGLQLSYLDLPFTARRLGSVVPTAPVVVPAIHKKRSSATAVLCFLIVMRSV
jgi:hypothetical protein